MNENWQLLNTAPEKWLGNSDWDEELVDNGCKTGFWVFNLYPFPFISFHFQLVLQCTVCNAHLLHKVTFYTELYRGFYCCRIELRENLDLTFLAVFCQDKTWKKRPRNVVLSCRIFWAKKCDKILWYNKLGERGERYIIRSLLSFLKKGGKSNLFKICFS